MSTITTRAGKGATLTNDELDANFTNLNTDKVEKSANLSDLAHAATARTNLGIPASIQNSDYLTLGTVAGVDVITAVADPTPAAYQAGQTFRFISAGANTVNGVTLNINGLGAKAVKKASALGPVDLVIGDIPAAGIVLQLTYDGTQFQVISGAGSAGGATGVPFCKNKLFNGEVTRINQRAFDGNWAAKSTWNSGNTIAQQELCYGYDMWAKASAIHMVQHIEAGNFRPSTVHTLSGIGVTTQQITSPASGDWAIVVPQTARNIQVEEGAVATPFEIRPVSFELAQCQRYFFAFPSSYFRTITYQSVGAGVLFSFPLPTTMRNAPAVTQPGAWNANNGAPTLSANSPSHVRVGTIATTVSGTVIFENSGTPATASAVI